MTRKIAQFSTRQLHAQKVKHTRKINVIYCLVFICEAMSCLAINTLCLMPYMNSMNNLNDYLYLFAVVIIMDHLRKKPRVIIIIITLFYKRRLL